MQTANTPCLLYGGLTQVSPHEWQSNVTSYQICNPPNQIEDPINFLSGSVSAIGSCLDNPGNLFALTPSGWQVDGYCWIHLVEIWKTLKPADLCLENPILPGLGCKRQEDTDYAGNGELPLRFSRIYNSSPHFGKDWKTNWNRSVSVVSAGGTTIATVSRPEGSYSFTWNGGSWVSDPDVNYQLIGSNGGFQVVTPNLQTEFYNPNNQLLMVVNASYAIMYTLTYDPVNIDQLVQVRNEFGHTINLAYDAQGRLSTMIDPNGGVYQYGYNSSDDLTSVTHPDGTVRQYVYNELAYTANIAQEHMLTGIIDENGVRYANFGYNADGLAIMTEHAGGVDRVQVSYDTPPQLSESVWIDVDNHVKYVTHYYSAPSGVVATNGLGATQSYSFASINGIIKTTGAGQPCSGLGCVHHAMAQQYDTNGNITRRVDYKYNYSCYEYDLARNLETARVEGFALPLSTCPSNLANYTLAANTRQRKVVTTWHPTFRTPISIVAKDRTTIFTHDANGNVLTKTVTDTSVTPNVSRTWTYTYNGLSQMLSEDGPRTDVSDLTTYTYYSCSFGNQCGQIETMTNALSQLTSYNSYNAHGQPTQITDSNNVVSTLGYDLRQRLTDRCVNGVLPTCTGGELTHLEYRPTGLLEKVTNPDGSYLQYGYDAAHRLTTLEDGLGNRIVYTLDAMSNLTGESVYDPSQVLTRTRSQVFNTLNQLWKQIGAAGTTNVTTVLGYDANGNQTTTSAPLGRYSTQQYDELNRLAQITDPALGNTVFGYDANDNLTSVKDPRNLTTSYQYTGFGDVKNITSPDTGVTTNTYDTGGNLNTSTDARNAIATYTYDALNRVQSVAFKKGTTTDQTISYSYDTGLNGLGRLTGASDASHSMSWGYDAQGRVTSKTQTIGTSVRTVGYGYTNGNLTSMTTPSGKLVTYGYANGQVTSIAVDGTTILNNVLYDAFGPARRWTWGNATQSIRTFDTDGKIQQIDSAGFSSYGYDDAFRITSITDTTVPANSWSYGYDSLDRLNSASKTGTTIGYTFDANGNRLTQTGTSASSYAIAATSNRLTATTGALVRTHTYDTAGNTLTTGATIHTYNNRGRMKTGRLSSTSTNTSYVYNALGQRVKKSGGTPGTVIFAYDEAGHLIGEYSATGTLVQETIWLGDIPVVTLRPKTGGYDIFYVHTDHLNTPRRVTRPSDNKLRWRWDPTPFGEGAPNENPQALGVFKYHLRFPGQYFDIETNLAYNYFRDYDSALGRYVESDPIGLRGGHNTYAYVYANPVSRIDPRGLQTPALCLNPANAAACAAAGEISEGTAAAVAAAAKRSAARAAAILLGYAAGREICKDAEEDCTEEIEACSELCAAAQADPDRRRVYGGSMTQCMKNCLPERCGGEPKWKGYK